MPLLIIPLLILGLIIVLGLAFALVAVLVKMLFVPALILIVILFWLRRDRQPHHSRTTHFEHTQYRANARTQRAQRRELHNVNEHDVKKPKKTGKDSWDDF
jgi:ABC-type multidrug transport system fused ATPase/permease subunit